ncbi:40S ribosomal protein S2 [Cricetulus griseus]|uniref:40S ribosomal protein S2 n=1 Tax=Cricetulus griseus TaxID=10029 RepID=G3H631_CRIGR|nr:40S ribosomal protein S2 [Cricetulus griseus]
MGEQDWRGTTVPRKVIGLCGSVLVFLIPTSRGTGIISFPMLPFASLYDHYTSARSCTATPDKEITFNAISKTYSHLSVDFWKETVFTKSPYQEFTDQLVKTHTRVSI